MKRPAIKFQHSKDWYLRMAAIEEAYDCDILAGKPMFYPPSIAGWTPPAQPKRTGKPKTRATPAKPKPARKRRATTTKSRG